MAFYDDLNEQQKADLDRYYQKGIKAIEDGLDPVTVNEQLRKLLEHKGIEGVAMPIDRSGSEERDPAISAVWANVKPPTDFSNVQAGGSSAPANEEEGFMRRLDNSATDAVAGALRTGGMALAGGVRAARKLVDPQAPDVPTALEDSIFDQVAKIGDVTNERRQEAGEAVTTAEKAGDVVGALAGGLGTLGMGMLGDPAAGVLERGGSLEQAYGTQAVNAAESLLTAGSGLGGIGYAAKAARQVPTALGATVAGAVAQNQITPDEYVDPLDPTNLALAAGGALAGAKFKSLAEERLPSVEVPRVDTNIVPPDSVAPIDVAPVSEEVPTSRVLQEVEAVNTPATDIPTPEVVPEVEAAPAPTAAELRAKLTERLRSRGIDVPDPTPVPDAVPAVEDAGVVQKAGLPSLEIPNSAKALLFREGAYPTLNRTVEQMEGMRSVGASAAQVNAKFLQDHNEAIKSPENYQAFQDAIMHEDPQVQIAAMEQLDKNLPEVGKRVREMVASKEGLADQIAAEIVRNPNSTTQQLAYATKVDEQRSNYTPDTFKVFLEKDYLKNKLNKADQAERILSRGGTPSAELAVALKSRQGAVNYMKRTLFDTDGQLRAEVTKRFGPNADADFAAKTVLDEWANIGSEGHREIARYIGGIKQDKGILATKDGVPKPLADWIGRVEDPLARAAMTENSQRIQLAQLKGMNDLREKGLSEGLFSQTAVKGKTTELKGPQYGALEGLHADPEFAKAIDSFKQVGVASSDAIGLAVHDANAVDLGLALAKRPLSFWNKTANMQKLINVVGAPGKWAWNVSSPVVSTIMNGNTNPATVAKATRLVGQLVGQDFKRTISPEKARLERLKVLEHSSISGTFDPKYKHAVAKLLGDTTKTQDAWDLARRLGRMAPKGYGAMDQISKIANFYNEEAFFTRQLTKNNPELGADKIKLRAEELAADRVNNTNVTPDRAAKIVQIVEGIGVTKFAKFMTETAHVVKNNALVGIEDVITGTGLKGGKPDLDATIHGVKRLAGVVAAPMLVKAVVPSLVAGAYGLAGLAVEQIQPDSAQDQFLKSNEFTKNGDLYSVTDAEGNNYTQDMAQWNPQDPGYAMWERGLDVLAATFKVAQEGATTVGETSLENKRKLKESVANLVETATGLIIEQGITKELTRDSTRTPTLANKAPGMYEELNKLLPVENANRVANWGQAALPLVTNAMESLTDKESTYPAQYLMASGIGLRKFDTIRDVDKYLATTAKMELNKAKQEYTNIVRAPSDLDKPYLERGFKKAMGAAVPAYLNMQKAYAAAKEVRKPGQTEEDVEFKFAQALSFDKFPKDFGGMLMSGVANPAVLVLSDLNSQAKSAIEEAYATSEQEGDKVAKRWTEKQAYLYELVEKYSNLTPEDVLNGDYK